MVALKWCRKLKGETGQGLDCAHLSVLNNGAPFSWADYIMSMYDGATLPSEMKFVEAKGVPLFNGNGWVNTSLIQSEPLLISLKTHSDTVESIKTTLDGFATFKPFAA